MKILLQARNFVLQVMLVVLTTWPVLAFDVPKLTSPVMDQVGLLSQPARNQMSDNIRRLYEQDVVQLQVLIVPSLQGEAVEQVAIQIFDQWKLGNVKKNNGVLVLAAIQDRKMRIEVGRGLEGAIPDVIAKRIITDVMRPLFKTQNYDLGFMLAVQAIGEAAATEKSGETFNVESFKEKVLSDSQLQKNFNDDDIQSFRSRNVRGDSNAKEGGGLPLFYVILFLVGLWFVILIISPSTAIWILLNLLSGGRGGGGGRGDGGGWSGGGGSSAGGGASGDW